MTTKENRIAELLDSIFLDLSKMSEQVYSKDDVKKLEQEVEKLKSKFNDFGNDNNLSNDEKMLINEMDNFGLFDEFEKSIKGQYQLYDFIETHKDEVRVITKILCGVPDNDFDFVTNVIDNGMQIFKTDYGMKFDYKYAERDFKNLLYRIWKNKKCDLYD